MSTEKFCKDCKYLRPIEGKDEEFWRCEKSELLVSRKYLITGDPKDEVEGMGYATVARMPGECGPEAKWFEPKPTRCPVCRQPHPADVACKPGEARDNGYTLTRREEL